MAAPPVVPQAGKLDLVIPQGSDWSLVLTIADSGGTAYDLTGVTAAAKVRAAFADVSSIVDITCTVTDAVNGVLTLSLTDTQTAALSAGGATSRTAALGYWDLKLTVSTLVTRYLEGRVTLSQEATK